MTSETHSCTAKRRFRATACSERSRMVGPPVRLDVAVRRPAISDGPFEDNSIETQHEIIEYERNTRHTWNQSPSDSIPDRLVRFGCVSHKRGATEHGGSYQMTDHQSRYARVTVVRQRLAIGALVVAGSVGIAGCTAHRVVVTRSCGSGSVQRTIVVSNRGAVGLAKVGLTPKVLKAEENC